MGAAPSAPSDAQKAELAETLSAQGSAALSLCTIAHPLHTRIANIFGTSISEVTMRPNPRPASLDRAAAAIAKADVLLLATGAGWSADSGLAVRSFPPTAIHRWPYSIALPIRPPCNYHSSGISAAEVRTARRSTRTSRTSRRTATAA
jgi:hypothetical protein